nr:reverse transcriptase domain-containing protein [Tanacetum cinerariifolium]
IKSFDGVFMAKKLMIPSKLVMKDPPGAIMVTILPLRKYLMPVSFSLLFTGMPMTWSHGVTLVNVKAKFHNGIDFMRPFLSSRGNKFILVVVDYLSKWVEAKALPTNDTRVVVKILKSLFARFGTLRAIISDRGTHFCNKQFDKVMLKYGVTHHLSTAYHPQTSGQVVVSNRGLKRILERTIGENLASWSEKLEDALWAFRTAYKTPIGAGDHRKLQLNELNELRDQAYENSLIYKEKTKKLHDSKIKNHIFNVGDRVLLFNSRLKIFSRKLKTRWTKPFIGTYDNWLSQIFKLPHGPMNSGSSQASDSVNKNSSAS